MKLVIDIPEAIYKRFNNEYYGENEVSKSVIFELFVSISHATPLPKGHGRLIDADKLDTSYVFNEYGDVVGRRYLTKHDLDNAPTIIDADKEVQ